MKDFKEEVDSYRHADHEYCIASEMIEAGYSNYSDCSSSDALSLYSTIYEDESESISGYCFSCAQSFQQHHLAKSTLADQLGLDPEDGKIREKKTFERKPKQPRITKEQIQEVMSHGYDATLKHGENRGKQVRGIKEKYNKFFGHVTKKDKNGNPTVRWYPETSDGKMMGYKSRTFLGKKFGYENYGITGIKNDLSGQVKFKDMHFRDICIVGGEEDKVAFFQQFDEYQEDRWGNSGKEYAPMPVVSPTTGEGSAVRQIRDQYDFVNRAERIFIGMDNDNAGRKAAAEIAEIFPKEKVFIIHWSYKDPNNAIDNKEGKDYSAQTIRDFFNAKPYTDSGVYDASEDMMQDVIDVLTTPRISLPPFAKKLMEMTKGSGLYTRSIYSLIGDTSVGKSTHIDAWIFHWMFELRDHHKVGIVSLEATKGEWVAGMLSTYLANNLWWIPQDEIEDYLETPEVKSMIHNFFYTKYGESRFSIVDDREGTVESLERCIQTLKSKYGCTIIVNDVLTDLLRVVDNESQARHFNWQSNFVKGDVTIFNVLHTRKPPSNRGGIPAFPDEYDTYGNSIFVQKSAGNFVIGRNKSAPNGDMIEQNTTYLRVPKLRKGITGDGGAWYYDGDTRKVYDRDQYFKDTPEKLPAGYDLSVSSFDKAYWEEGGRGWDGVTKQGFSGKKSFKKESVPEPDIMDGVPL